MVVTILLWKWKEGHLWQGWKMGSQIQESIKIFEKFEGKTKELTFPQIPFLCNSVILTNEWEQVFV